MWIPQTSADAPWPGKLLQGRAPCRGLGEGEENTRLSGRMWHWKHIAGSGELAPPTWMLHRSSSRLLQEVEQSCASGLSRKKDVIQSFTGLFEVRKEWISESNRMLPVPHFPEQPFSLDNHKYKYCQITPRSWPDAPNVFTENESFRHRPVSKNRTPEVLGSAPVLSWRERL